MSNFTIKYNSNVQNTDSFSVQDGLTPTQLIEVSYVDSPLLGSTTDETIQRTVFFLENVYNTTNLYIITADYINDEILITANNSNSSFTEESNDTSGRVTITINNTPGAGTFTIDSVALSEAASGPCNNVELTITTTPQATDITSPIVDTVGSNPYVTEIQRVGNTVITMNDANDSDSVKLFIPALVSGDFEVQTVLAPNSGTATIVNNYTNPPAFTLEYSLDNVTWYQSNSFSGLAIGNYTAYVRDGIGCDFSITFQITAFSPTIDPRIAYTFVSNSGSFRFKLNEDLTTNIPTVYNTLSYEENVDNNDRYYKQPYQISDGIITTQFKSSYETNQAFIIDCDGVETALTVTQKTQNLNIEDVRDGRVISTEYLGQNYVSVQFGSGNTYDPVTLLVNGTYSLGTELPDWIDINEYLNIQNSGWVKVIDIVRIDGVNTAIMNYLVSDYPETIDQQGLLRRITSVYNQLPYEVYEFDTDLSLLNGDYQIRIDLTDSEFTSVSYLSEWINVSEKQEKTHLYQWYNTINNEINYSTGIVNKARFKYVYNLQWIPNNEQETFVANTNTVQIDSTVRNYYVVKLHPVPTAMAQKHNLLLANNRIFVDNINFQRETEPEVIYYNSTNLYQINQQLTEGDYIFTSTLSDGSAEIDCGTSLAIQDVGKGLLLIEDN